MAKRDFVVLVAISMMFSFLPSMHADSLPDCPYMLISAGNQAYQNDVYIPQELTDDVLQMEYRNIFYGFSNIFNTNLDQIVQTPYINGNYWFKEGKLSSQIFLETSDPPTTPTSMLERNGSTAILGRNFNVYPNDNFYCRKDNTKYEFYDLDSGKMLCSVNVAQNSVVIPIGKGFSVIMSNSDNGSVINIENGKTVFSFKGYLLNYGDGVCITWDTMYDASSGKSFKLDLLGISNVHNTRIRENCIDFFEFLSDSAKIRQETLSVWRYSRVDGSITQLNVNIPSDMPLRLLDAFENNVLVQYSKSFKLALVDTSTGDRVWSLDTTQSIAGEELFLNSRILNTKPKKVLLWGINWISLVNLQSGELEKKISIYNNNYPGEVFQCGNKLFVVKRSIKNDPVNRLFLLDTNLSKKEIQFPTNYDSLSWSAWSNKVVFWTRKNMSPDSPAYISYYFFDANTMKFSPENVIEVEAGMKDVIQVSGKFLLSCFGLRQTLVDLETGARSQVDLAPKHACSGGFIGATDGIVYVCLNFDNSRYSRLYSFDSSTLQRLGQSQRINPIERINFATPDAVVCSGKHNMMSVSDCNCKTTETTGMPLMLEGNKLYFNLNGKLMSVNIDTTEKQLVNEKCMAKWRVNRLGNNYCDGSNILDQNFDIKQMNVRLRNQFLQDGKMLGQTSSSGLMVELVPASSLRVNYEGQGKITITNTRNDGFGKDLEGYALIFGMDDPQKQAAYSKLQKIEFSDIGQGQSKLLEFDDSITDGKAYVAAYVFSNGVRDFRKEKVQNKDYPQYYGFVYDYGKNMTIIGKAFKR